jgi:hypothetical protein
VQTLSERLEDVKKYRLIAYVRVDPEGQEPMTYEEAQTEKEQQEFLFPENVYRIEEVETPPTDRKEESCIPPESRKN